MSREILFRGFHECENGTQIAVVNGTEYRGKWVFGYFWTNEAGNCFIKVIRDLNGNFVGNPTTKDYEVFPETVCEWTGLTDKNEKKIFEGDRVIPVWVSPSGKIDGLDEDMQGKVIYKAGSFYVVPSCEMEYGIDTFVKRKFIEYRSNVGDIYDFENNVFLGEVIGTIFDKEEV